MFPRAFFFFGKGGGGGGGEERVASTLESTRPFALGVSVPTYLTSLSALMNCKRRGKGCKDPLLLRTDFLSGHADSECRQFLSLRRGGRQLKNTDTLMYTLVLVISLLLLLLSG